MAVIKVENIRKSYSQHQVLDNISFEVEKGEIVAIIGPSGAGKTTLMRCIASLDKPDEGKISFNGNGKIKNGKKRKIGMVFQEFNLIPRLTVLMNVLVGRLGYTNKFASLLGIFPDSDIEIALESIKKVGLEHKINEKVSKISGGEKQRVGIARALTQEPEVILADEPVSNLDPKTGEKILNDFVRICREKDLVVIMNLHQIDYAKNFANRIIGLNQGKIVFEGTPSQLTERAVKRIYM